MDSILDWKHVSSVLRFLASEGTVKRNQMLSVVPSNAYLDKLLPELEKRGLAVVESRTLGRKIIFISLTEKGRELARIMEKAERAAEGTALPLVEFRRELYSRIDNIVEKYPELGFPSVEEFVLGAVREKLENMRKNGLLKRGD